MSICNKKITMSAALVILLALIQLHVDGSSTDVTESSTTSSGDSNDISASYPTEISSETTTTTSTGASVSAGSDVPSETSITTTQTPPGVETSVDTNTASDTTSTPETTATTSTGASVSAGSDVSSETTIPTSLSSSSSSSAATTTTTTTTLSPTTPTSETWSNATSLSTSASTFASATSAVITTAVSITTTRPTTTPIPVVPEKDQNFDNYDYTLTFSVVLNEMWNASSADNTNITVGLIVYEAYKDCPGYKGFVVTKLGSSDRTNTGNVEIKTYADSGLSFINATYNIKLSSETVTNERERVVYYISNNATNSITTNSLVNGNLTAEDMSQQLTSQESYLRMSLCVLTPATACDPCYDCFSSPNICKLGCQKSHEYCQVLDNSNNTAPWTYTCNCEPYYLPISGDCVHQDWIIGLSAGIGGFIVVTLTIAVVYLVLEKRRKSSLSRSSSKNRLNPNDELGYTSLMVGSEPKVDDPQPGVMSALDEPTNVDEAAAAEAAAAKEEAERQRQLVEEREDQLKRQSEEMQALRDQIQQLESKEQEVVEVHAVATAVPEVASQSTSEVMAPTAMTKSPYDQEPQQDYTTSSAFVPQLSNIDPYANYSIKRPVAMTSSTAPRTSYHQNPSYQDFF